VCGGLKISLLFYGNIKKIRGKVQLEKHYALKKTKTWRKVKRR